MARQPFLREAIAIDAKGSAKDALGGQSDAWAEIFTCRAEFIYRNGGEAVQAARQAGRVAYKVKIRSNATTRAVVTGNRMRWTLRGPQSGELPGAVFDIKTVDSITDPQWVWLEVEGDAA